MLRVNLSVDAPPDLIDGKALAAKVREEVAAEVEELGDVGLTTVLVGDDPPPTSTST